LMAVSRQFEKVPVDDLCAKFGSILKGSPEEGAPASESGAAPGEASDAIAPAAMGKQEALKRFTSDLTEQARGGKMDPIVGRDDEIRQVVDILMRRRQNNPILVGEAGVGKTAVVEGFAQRIVRGDVPPTLKDVQLLALDVGLLQAGASMKGEFEQRLRSVIDEVQASEKPIILFIDETQRWWAPAGRPAPATRPTCSSRRWRVASCAPSEPPPSPSTKSTSKKTRR
jgi:type VI secretion system protein VasG